MLDRASYITLKEKANPEDKMEKKGEISVIAVANYLLKKSYPLSLLQIIKLCYISYGYVAGAFQGTKLFPEKITARRYGPSIEDLFYRLEKTNKPDSTTKTTSDYVVRSNSLENEPEVQATTIPPKYTEMLDFIHAKYAHIDGLSLSALTHKRGTPWEQTIRPEYDPKKTYPISHKCIEEYFYKLLHNKS